MSGTAVVDRYANVIGNKREDIGSFVAISNDGFVRTKLYFIESLTVWGTINQSSNITTWKNSTTASEVEDDPGWFHFNDAGIGGDPTGLSYQFVAVGW